MTEQDYIDLRAYLNTLPEHTLTLSPTGISMIQFTEVYQ